MSKILPLFKPWVPEWLIKVTMFIVLLPSFILFFLPLSNVTAAAGHYGIEPYDVQYSVVLFYAGYTSFFSLERRFFSYLATKEYFYIITFIQITTSLLCYITNDLEVLLPLRFIQGMAFASLANLSLSIIFNRLKSERSREIGYSVFFGMLICMIPFNNLITADLIDSYNFNTLYKSAVFSFVPCLILLGITMNNVRLNIKFPLYQLDWASFILYGSILSLVGYICVYGQEFYWFEDIRIRVAAFASLFLTCIFTLRQLNLKRPYFKIEIFSYRNFLVGALLLFILYICRFASGITNNYFSIVLGLDPMHVSYLNIFNIAGMVTGVITSCYFVLQHRPARLIWIYGFAILLIYHVWMFFLFNIYANEQEFYLPLFAQGLGIGLIMTPTIVYMISSVPVHLGPTAAGIGLLVRCFGFYASIALLNYFELFEKSRHYNAFQDHLNLLSPFVKEKMMKQSNMLASKGLQSDIADKIELKLLVKSIDVQGQIRYAMDYFELISILLVPTILLICLFPYLNRTVNYLKSNELPPI